MLRRSVPQWFLLFKSSISRLRIGLVVLLCVAWMGAGAAYAQMEADWKMFGGNAAHTGLNSGETGVPPLQLDWAKSFGPAALNPVTVEGNRVFVTAATRFGPSSLLHALDAKDGSELWNYNFGSVNSVNPPAVSDGMVYVQMGNHTPASRLFAFDAMDGTVYWSSPFGAQWERYYAPTIAEGKVFVNAGYYGGTYGFEASTGRELFFQGLAQYDEWTPAYANGTLYSYVAGILRAHSPNNGATLWSVQVPWNWSGWSMNTVAVIGDNRAFIIAPPSLYGVDLTTRAVAWTGRGSYTSTPAYADSVVYAISGGELHAREAVKGELLWMFRGDGQLKYPPVIANGFLYASSSSNVYALDLSQQTQVWSAPVGGWLTMANGKLYVAQPNGTLSSYMLSQSE